MGRAMVMAENVVVWWAQARRNEKRQNHKKLGAWPSAQGQNTKGNKKPGWGEKGSGNAVQGKVTANSEGASNFGFVVAVAMRTGD